MSPYIKFDIVTIPASLPMDNLISFISSKSDCVFNILRRAYVSLLLKSDDFNISWVRCFIDAINSEYD